MPIRVPKRPMHAGRGAAFNNAAQNIPAQGQRHKCVNAAGGDDEELGICFLLVIVFCDSLCTIEEGVALQRKEHLLLVWPLFRQLRRGIGFGKPLGQSGQERDSA